MTCQFDPNLGICRRVDEIGRVCLPKTMRHLAQIVDGDLVEVYLDPQNKTLMIARSDKNEESGDS